MKMGDYEETELALRACKGKRRVGTGRVKLSLSSSMADIARYNRQNLWRTGVKV
jgi:hypothetical protein